MSSHCNKRGRKENYLDAMKHNGLRNAFEILHESDAESQSDTGVDEVGKFPNEQEGWTTALSKRNRSSGHRHQKTREPLLSIDAAERPGIVQMHRLIIAVLNAQHFNEKWARYSGNKGTSNSQPKVLFVVAPYLSFTFLNKYCNKSLTPFLENRKDFIRASKPLYIRATADSCSILDGVLLEPRQKVNELFPFNLLTEVVSESKDPNMLCLKSLLVKEDEIEVYDYPKQYSDWVKRISKNHVHHELQPCQLSDIELTRFSPEHLDVLCQDTDLFNILGLDCEMCLTERGREVVRISAVQPVLVKSQDANVKESATKDAQSSHQPLELRLRVLLDTLVKPQNPVVDYLSRYSGVTQQDLAEVNVTLEDVQEALSNVITKDTILVGHSLENDLQCLKIFHPRIIDSALLYNHHHPPLRHALKYLAYTFLGGLSIQGRRLSGDSSHNSVEDAAVAVELVLLRRVHLQSIPNATRFKPDLALQLKSPVQIYDILQHNMKNHSLISHSYTLQFNEIDGQNDQDVVRSCIRKLRKNLTDEKLHICFLRDFQKLAHQMIGGIHEPCHPSAIYNITKRISRFVTLCAERKKSEDLALQANPNLSEKVETPLDQPTNWLSCLKASERQTSIASQPLYFNEVPKEEITNDMDQLGEIWCQNLSKSIPISDPYLLFPALNKKKIHTFLKILDEHLTLLFDTLKKGDLMIVYSGCGNPIPYMGLSALQRQLFETSDSSQLDLSPYINYNEDFCRSRLEAQIEFKEPFACFFHKSA